MNIITRIALSLSLIAFIAQPVQAASYADHAKKAGRIAWNLAQIGIGSGCLLFSKKHVKKTYKFTKYAIYHKCKNNDQSLVDLYSEMALKHLPKSLFAIPGGLLIANGIYGLKKEIFPNFHPIESIKNKFSKKITELAD